MTTWDKVAGDVGDTITPILDGVADLSTVTAVEAHVWRGTTAPVTLSAAVASAPARTLTVNLGSWLAGLTSSGTWSIEYQVTFTGGVVRTWPDGEPDTIRVRKAGG